MKLRLAISNLIISGLVMSPFVGNGAIQRDVLQGMFQAQTQIVDKYVIPQDFKTTNILNEEFLKNKDYIVVRNPLDVENLITYQNMLRIMPMGLEATTDSGMISKYITDQTLKAITESQAFQNLKIVQAAKSLEGFLSADLTFDADQPLKPELQLAQGGENNKAHPIHKGIEHRVSFNIYALQQSAKLTYTGIFNASVQYKNNNNEVNLAISKEISSSTSVSLEHFANDVDGNRQMISLSMNF